jgi:hypothetical protein
MTYFMVTDMLLLEWYNVGTWDLSYTEMLCVLVTLATSDTGVTSPRPEHHRQAGWN